MNSIEKLKNIKLFFVVTTGRSGTAFLARYISKIGHPCALHEPAPPFHPVMRKALYDSAVAGDFWLRVKAPAISSLGVDTYVETSHLVAKGFLEPLFENGVYPNLILLRRRNRDVAKSLFYLNTIPGRTEAGLEYYLKPDDPNVHLPLSDWSGLSDYQLCYWYTLEMEKRQHYYAEIVSKHGAGTLQLDFDDLMSGKKYNEIADFLKIPRGSFIKQLKMKLQTFIKVNSKTRRKLKKSVTASVDFKKEEADLLEYLKLNLPFLQQR